MSGCLPEGQSCHITKKVLGRFFRPREKALILCVGKRSLTIPFFGDPGAL